ncbi:phytanoyl-CoA dioxygenase family protein [Algisphaera agarilytica]|uniref:Chlorinating enzyme n=1 Tax=Algisphaera agarilytica TaxID=1385975 RepID=A0A7X0H3D1_9BACT|nr:phytanoyl-CoA dioxygenase family protein [Algisphaera agarilytica]MBB6428532.1 chlorinating enzyme [Algisphaera agarilytica]
MPTSSTRSPDTLDGIHSGFLTPEAQAFYAEQGYLIVENAVSPEQLAAINDETLRMCRGELGRFDGWTGPHDGQSDLDVLRQYLCIHFPHKLSPLMHEQLAHPAIVETLTGVIGPDVKCMQSMLFIKAAGKPGQAWHQDEDYIPTRDRSLTGAWIALDDATVDNGCLWVIPGSHKPGVLWPQKFQKSQDFDCTHESYGYPYTDEDAVPVEVKAGSIVFFNGYLLHRSLPNRAPEGTFRRVLVNHYMSASSLLPWINGSIEEHDTFLDDDRSIAKTDVRDIVMIAGNDPYAWMGIKERNEPHVRPTGEGGCSRGETKSEIE